MSTEQKQLFYYVSNTNKLFGYVKFVSFQKGIANFANEAKLDIPTCLEIFINLSKRNVVDVVYDPANSDNINVYCNGYRFWFTFNREYQQFNLLSGSKANSIDNRKIRNEGKSIYIDKICIEYRDGLSVYKYNEYGIYDKNCAPDLMKLFVSSSSSDEQEENEPNEHLEELLDLAENYAYLNYQDEQIKIKELGGIIYKSCNPTQARELDRVTYNFEIVFNKDQEDSLKESTMVQIGEDNALSGEISEVFRENNDSTKPIESINILFKGQIDGSLIPKEGLIFLSSSTVVRDVQIDAIEKIRKGEAKAKYINKVLKKYEGEDSKNSGFTPLNQQQQTLLDELIAQEKYPPNKSQLDAIKRGIESDDVFMVMGPPGTGKTTVIKKWVDYFTRQGKRVLISSKNNKAVDNVLEKFTESKDIDMIRIGSEKKISSPTVKPFIFETKIDNKRKEIIDVTNDECLKLKQYIEELQIAKSKTQELYDVARQLFDTGNDYYVIQQKRNEVLSNIEVIKNNLAILSKKYNDLDKFIKETNVDIEMLKSKSLITILLPFLNLRKIKLVNFQKKAMEELEQVHSDILSNQKVLETYQEELPSEEVLENAKNNYFSVLDNYSKNHAGSTEVIMPDNDVYNPLQFKSYSIKENINSTEVNPVIKIDEAIDTTTELIDILSYWNDETQQQKNYELNDVMLESVQLVGATCIGINSQKRFANLDFDVTIIDEAGQIQIHDALVPMSVSNKLIMLGDHKQIPPNAMGMDELCEENDVDPYLLETSLFEYMYNDKNGKISDSKKTMLDTQYRIPAEVADTISKWFYGGKYLSFKNNYGVEGVLKQITEKPYVIIDTSNEENRHEKENVSAGACNILEADICVSIIDMLSKLDGFDVKEIGVISGYKLQVNTIKSKVSNIIKDYEIVNNMVASLDSFQGQERDVIIYSFTKSSNISPKRDRIGFLKELRRLNVAMSRGKKQLFLVGDMDFLSSCEKGDCDENGIGLPGTEKAFSQFIKLMIEDVKAKGEYLTYSQFKQKAGISNE